MSDVNSGAPAPGAAPVQGSGQPAESQGQAAPAAQGNIPASSGGGPLDRVMDEVAAKYQGKAQKKDAPTIDGDDVEDDGSDLPPEKNTKPRKHKLNVKGREIEVDEKELMKRAQMGYAADEKWQEAARMRKQIEGMVQLLQKDPTAFLEKAGFNVDELMEKRIEQKLENMKKTPEQLELERLRREHETILSERERERQEAHEQNMKRMQSEFAVQVESEIMQALDNPEFGLPKSPYFVKRIADVLIYDIKKNKKQTISAAKAAEIVRDEVKSEWQEVYQLSPDEVFEQMVGKDRLNKYRRSKVKKPAAAPSLADVKPTGQSEIRQTTEERPKEKLRSRDFFKKLGSK